MSNDPFSPDYLWLHAGRARTNPPLSASSTRINDNIKFLVQFRPLSLAMGNAIRHVKALMAQTREMTEEATRDFLVDAIEAYVRASAARGAPLRPRCRCGRCLAGEPCSPSN